MARGGGLWRQARGLWCVSPGFEPQLSASCLTSLSFGSFMPYEDEAQAQAVLASSISKESEQRGEEVPE